MSEKNWSAWFKLVPIALGIGFMVLAISWVFVRAQMISHNEVAVATLDAQMTEMKTQHEADQTALRARVDYLESVLFGDVVAKVAQQSAQKQKPAITPQWWVTRDRENRQKIQALEWKVYTLENRVEGK